MRCNKCEYLYYDSLEKCKLCLLFGYCEDNTYVTKKGFVIHKFTVNSKGEEGCIFTKKQLDRMYDRQKLLKEYFEYMESE